MFRLTAFLLSLFCAAVGISAEPTHLLKQPYSTQYLWIDSLRNASNSLDSSTYMSTFEKLERWADKQKDVQFSQTARLIRYRWLKDRGLHTEGLDKMYKD